MFASSYRTRFKAFATLVPAFAAFGISGDLQAHKLQVFAFAEGDRISGSAYYAGGGAARGARIEVRDGDGRLVAELTPDTEGHFFYQPQAQGDYRLKALTPDGHQAEWLISADELIGAGTPTSPSERPLEPLASPEPLLAEFPLPSQSTGVALDPRLEAAVERAVARQIRPLREQLIAAEERARVADILGGLGYILGLTGLALWWRRRPARRG